MLIPGLTLLDAPSSQPASARHDNRPTELPIQPLDSDTPTPTSADQYVPILVLATRQLASVRQDPGLSSLGETEAPSELSIHHSGNLDVLDRAIAEESSETDSAKSEGQCTDPDGANNGTEEQESNDEGSTSGSDDDEIMTNLINASRFRSMDELLDDEEEDESGSKKNALKTAHESIEESGPVDLAHVTVNPNAPVECLGNIETMLDSLVIVKAQTDGEYRVLSEGSLVLSASRALIGAISETFGPVKQPRYVVRLTEIARSDMSLANQDPLFYIPNEAAFIFTQALRGNKGSDASNLYDEEVDEDEREFSDDEAELEHKRTLKRKRVPEADRKGNSRHTQNQKVQSDRDQVLTYRRLSRPSHHSTTTTRRDQQSMHDPDSRPERVPHPPQLSTLFVAPQYWTEYSRSTLLHGHSLPVQATQVPPYDSFPPGAYVNPTFLAPTAIQPIQTAPLPPDIQQQIDILNSTQRLTRE